MSTTLLDVQAVRARFSSLQGDFVFLDAPGGSQVPDEVGAAIARTLRDASANIGANYETSKRVEHVLATARADAGRFLNCSPDDVIFGTNMTVLDFTLSRTASRDWKEGDRILVSRLDHDGGVAPWIELAADRGFEVDWIDVTPDLRLDLDDLERKLDERVRVVACVASSNAVGTIVDLPRVSELAHAVGALSARVTSPEDAVEEACAAVRRALHERRTVLLNLPLQVQALDVPDGALDLAAPPAARAAVEPTAADTAALAEVLERARRPVFVAGRGARTPGGRDAVAELAQHYGALLATSAVARGLFHGNPWSLDVSGGFSSPLAAELIQGADLIVGWGCALNMWTMRHGSLIGADTTVVQVDDEASALGTHRDVQLGVTGDVELTAQRVLDGTGGGGRR